MTNGLRDRDGFMVMMPEGSVGRIPLESRNRRSNWTPPRQRRSPGQIPFRDAFIQEFPVRSFGARNKRNHRAEVLGNIVRIQDLYAGIYPEGELAPGRSPWPDQDEIQKVLKRERRASRPALLAQMARDAKLAPLDYLERNVERYLLAQGYDLHDGSAPSTLALAIAAQARVEGADEPPEGIDALAAENDDWLDQDDVARLQRQETARGYIAIGTQKGWNGRTKAWEFMLTGHLAYDILDDVGPDLVYIHPYGIEGKNHRGDAAFALYEENRDNRHHLLSGHPRNPLLTPRPVMRFSFRTQEWGMSPGDIAEHRPRIIAPYTLRNGNGLWHVTVPGVRTYLREGILPENAFVAKRRAYAPPSDTRASKPRPEGLRTYRDDGDGSGWDVAPGPTLDDVIDETGLDQVLSGVIVARPIQQAGPQQSGAAEDAAAVGREAGSTAVEKGGRSDGGTTGALEYPDDDNFGALVAYLQARGEDPESRLRQEEASGSERPGAGADEAGVPEESAPAGGEGDENAPEALAPSIPVRPVIQKRIGPGGKRSYGVAVASPPAPVIDRYPYVRILGWSMRCWSSASTSWHICTVSVPMRTGSAGSSGDADGAAGAAEPGRRDR